jgi:hypothetical protein
VLTAFHDAFVQVFEHGVGLIDLVADGAEVVADTAEVGAAGGGVLQEPGGVGAEAARCAGVVP